MTSKELRDLEAAKLAAKLTETREELFKTRFQHASAQLEKTHRIPELKKTIARILTIQRERASEA